MNYLAVKVAIVLYISSTNIIGWEPKCAKIENVFATVDFGPWNNETQAFQGLWRLGQKSGPLVNSEFYPGWINRWEMPPEHIDTELYAKKLDNILAMNASVNIYPFCGGTLFGFTAGASHAAENDYHSVVTSYEFDGPLTECGDPTEKYFAIRNVVGKYLPLPSDPIPTIAPKMETPDILMRPIATVFDERFLTNPIQSEYPQTFDELKLGYGFVLYSHTVINPSTISPEAFTIYGLADRAYVFVDKEYRGTLSRAHKTYQLMIKFENNTRLDILVENQGRFAYTDIDQPKGITKNVTFVRPLYDIVLKNWTHNLFFKNWEKTIDTIESSTAAVNLNLTKTVPTFFTGTFQLSSNITKPLDTFLRLDGWGKGVAFLNGFNLGRYWPLAGPQITLYAPSNLFKPYPQQNTITVFELEKNPCASESGKCVVKFVKDHVLNETAYNEFATTTLTSTTSTPSSVTGTPITTTKLTFL